MSTITVEREAGAPAATSAEPAPIPLTRIIGVELRKMFDTRSGFWLMASIGITALLATGAVILFAPDSALTFDSFAAAIGVPMTIILPIIAILSVTSEWSQRSGLTTFTLVPHRGRVIWAKAISPSVVGVVSMLRGVLHRRARQRDRHGDHRRPTWSGTSASRTCSTSCWPTCSAC